MIGCYRRNAFVHKQRDDPCTHTARSFLVMSTRGSAQRRRVAIRRIHRHPYKVTRLLCLAFKRMSGTRARLIVALTMLASFAFLGLGLMAFFQDPLPVLDQRASVISMIISGLRLPIAVTLAIIQILQVRRQKASAGDDDSFVVSNAVVRLEDLCANISTLSPGAVWY
jgi:hypothetical protein